ncbi:hypothetical protein Tco_0691021 [Tanacetum coccineum]
MTSFDYHLDPIYAIKECSSCGSLYTSNCGCSKGSLEDKILVPIPESSQRPLKFEKNCLDCGDPVHSLYCRGCALIRKTFEEVFQDLQDTSESSDDNPNIVNAPQEPFVGNQDPVLWERFDQFQPPQYTINHPILNTQNELLNSQNKLMEQMTTLRDLVGQVIQKKEEEKRIAEEQAAKDRYWKIPICYDDDEDDTIAITPVLPIKEPDNSLSMGDEHLNTVSATESDEVIKSSVEDLIPI